LKKYSKFNFLKGDGKFMFKKVLLSSVLLTGVLGASTAFAQTDTVNSENQQSVENVETSVNSGLIDFKFSTTYTADELLHVNNEYGAVIGIFSDKPFEYNVILKNTETNELIHGTATGYFIFDQYQAEVSFGPLKDGTYQVIFENPTGTEQQGKFGVYTYGSK
jgi:nucleoside-specific outer membrane channel protein Tsx